MPWPGTDQRGRLREEWTFEAVGRENPTEGMRYNQSIATDWSPPRLSIRSTLRQRSNENTHRSAPSALIPPSLWERCNRLSSDIYHNAEYHS